MSSPTRRLDRMEDNLSGRLERRWTAVSDRAAEIVCAAGLSDAAQQRVSDRARSIKGEPEAALSEAVPTPFAEWWTRYWETLCRFEQAATAPGDVPTPPPVSDALWTDAMRRAEADAPGPLTVLAFARAYRERHE